MFGRYLSTEIMNTLLGAPQAMDDRTLRAIACAIDMQNAMAGVNAINGQEGPPYLKMGIGINGTEVVVGSIGSSKRSKYAVVGSGVNVTSRIESFSVGGQILISDSVYRQAGGVLRIDASHFYGKVIECRERPEIACIIRFTSLPPEINAYFQAHLELAKD